MVLLRDVWKEYDPAWKNVLIPSRIIEGCATIFCYSMWNAIDTRNGLIVNDFTEQLKRFTRKEPIYDLKIHHMLC